MYSLKNYLTTINSAIISILLFTVSCSGGDDSDTKSAESKASDSKSSELIRCGSHNGNQLYKGPRDGCYYNNSNNNKTYVDRSACSCLN